jgi:hypothetical protein
MALGSLQMVPVCQPVSTGATVAPCQTVSGIKYRPAMMSVYVIDPSNSNFFDMALEPLDTASVATVFSLAFSFVLLCFLMGRGVGVVLSLIRRG